MNKYNFKFLIQHFICKIPGLDVGRKELINVGPKLAGWVHPSKIIGIINF